MSDSTMTPTPAELAEAERANGSNKQPVVFVHGLWLLDSSWERWAVFFEDAGYVAVTPGWPDDPGSVADARSRPDVFAGKSVGDVAAYQQAIIEKLDQKPAIIGHSFGGVLVQILAGRGLAAATCAISPAPSRGVLPLPVNALKAAAPVLANPANRGRAITLTYDQFRFGFASSVSEQEAKELYDQFHVAGSGVPLFQAAFANVNPGSEVKAKKKGEDRGPRPRTLDHDRLRLARGGPVLLGLLPASRCVSEGGNTFPGLCCGHALPTDPQAGSRQRALMLRRRQRPSRCFKGVGLPRR